MNFDSKKECEGRKTSKTAYTRDELITLAKHHKIKYYYKMNKSELCDALSNITSPKKKIKESCNVVPYVVKNAAFFNRALVFVYDHFKYENCYLVYRKKGKHIDTRCRTSVESVVYLLTGRLYPNNFDYFIYPYDEVSEDINYITETLTEYNLMVLSVGSTDIFPGHILVIIKIDSSQEYYILQSYIFEYELRLSKSTKQGIDKLIASYLLIFNGKITSWSEEHVTIWKKITGVDASDIVGASIPRSFRVYYPYEKVNINNKKCKKFVTTLLNDTTNKLNRWNKSLNVATDITDMFGDLLPESSDVSLIKDKVELKIQEMKKELIELEKIPSVHYPLISDSPIGGTPPK